MVLGLLGSTLIYQTSEPPLRDGEMSFQTPGVRTGFAESEASVPKINPAQSALTA
jgi:hypothetical protein